LSVYGWGGKKEPNGMDFYYKRKRNVQRWAKGIWGFFGGYEGYEGYEGRGTWGFQWPQDADAYRKVFRALMRHETKRQTNRQTQIHSQIWIQIQIQIQNAVCLCGEEIQRCLLAFIAYGW